MFETLSMAPSDPILGLNELFKKDPRAGKINLSVGVYKDAEGLTSIFESVKQAERRILQEETTKDYLGIQGLEAYGAAVRELIFGQDHEIVAGGRAATAQTPGGTAALRVAAELIEKMVPSAQVWVSQPTWPNHNNIFQAAGLTVKTYPYFDPAANALAFPAMLEALQRIPAGDAVLLHGCCHNPTGADPTPAQWSQIAEVVQQRKLLPLVDLAYQGLAVGMAEDAAGVLTLCRPGQEVLIASSFSKNFGLYNERVGALTAVAPDAKAAEVVLSQIKSLIRANYSNPPAHGAAIVAAIVNDPKLRRQWQGEVAAMRDRIHLMRKLFVQTLKAKGVKRDFSFIMHQQGMFSFSGLAVWQVMALRDKYGIYIVESGRINVAGMTESNMDALCQAIAEVLA